MLLLEREAQLSALASMLSKAEDGAGRVVLIAGDAGSGKSALVRQFSDSVSGKTRSLWGLCDPLSTPRPLGPLVDIAPQLGEPVSSLLEGGHREGVFEATLAALRAYRNAVVVVIEDLQWADESTLDLVRFLARRLADSKVLLLVTYRHERLAHDRRLRALLGDLASVPVAYRLTVPPLSLEAVSELAAPTGLDAAMLHRETGGNAFFVTEVLSSGGNRLPASIADAVMARAAHLSSSARSALDAAAVVGPRIESSVILAMDGVGPDELDECVAGGMLVYEASFYTFRHELARQAVLDAIPPARRTGLHADALARLITLPGHQRELDRLAYHAVGAGNAAATLEYAPAAAAAAAALQSHREAAAHYQRALRYAEHLDPAPRADLLERASYEDHLIDDLPRARSLGEQALGIWRELGDKLRTGDCLRRLSRIYWLSGHTAIAESAIDEAVTMLEALPPGRELAAALSARAQQSMLEHDDEGAERRAEEAIRLAAALDDTAVRVHALNTLGVVRLWHGDSSGETLLLESLQLAVKRGLEDDAARAWTNLGATHLDAFALPKARRYLEDGMRYAAEHDLDSDRACLAGALISVCVWSGQWDEAASLATRLLAARETARITKALLMAWLALVYTRRGDIDPRPMLEDAMALANRAGDLQFRAPVAAAWAEAAWFRGATSDIEREVGPVLALALEKGVPSLIGELSYWMWKAGCLTTPVDRAFEPYRLQITGDWRAAHRVWEKLGCPYQAALALADSTDESDLRLSIEGLERLGARPAIAEVTQKLRRLGAARIPRGPRPATRTNPAGLTAREMDVLALLEKGLSNADIAKRLFLSEKTVDHHVSAILGKVDAKSRHEAVQRLRVIAAS